MAGSRDGLTLDEKLAIKTLDGRRLTLDELNTTYGTEKTAELLGLKPSTLHNARWRGDEGFPPYVKIGGRVRYRAVDIHLFLIEQTRQSTSEGLEIQDEDEDEIQDDPLDERAANGPVASPSTPRDQRPIRGQRSSGDSTSEGAEAAGGS